MDEIVGTSDQDRVVTAFIRDHVGHPIEVGDRVLLLMKSSFGLKSTEATVESYTEHSLEVRKTGGGNFSTVTLLWQKTVAGGAWWTAGMYQRRNEVEVYALKNPEG